MAFTADYLSKHYGDQNFQRFDATCVRKRFIKITPDTTNTFKLQQLSNFTKLKDICLVFSINNNTNNVHDIFDISAQPQTTYQMLTFFKNLTLTINNIKIEPYLKNWQIYGENAKYIQFKNQTLEEIKEFTSQYGIPYQRNFLSNNPESWVNRTTTIPNTIAYTNAGIVDNLDEYSKAFFKFFSEIFALNSKQIVLPLFYFFPILDNENYLTTGANLKLQVDYGGPFSSAGISYVNNTGTLPYNDLDRHFTITNQALIYSEYIFAEDIGNKLAREYQLGATIIYPFLISRDYQRMTPLLSTFTNNTTLPAIENFFDIPILTKGQDLPQRFFISPISSIGTNPITNVGPRGEQLTAPFEIPYFLKRLEINKINENQETEHIFEIQSKLTPNEWLSNQIYNPSCEEIHRRLTLSRQNNGIYYYENEENCWFDTKPYMVDLKNLLDQQTITDWQSKNFPLKMRIELYTISFNTSLITPFINPSESNHEIRIYYEYFGKALLTEKGFNFVPYDNAPLTSFNLTQ